MSDLSSIFAIWLVALLLFAGFILVMVAFWRNRSGKAEGRSFFSRSKDVIDEEEVSIAPHRLQRIRGEKNETSDS